MTRVAACEEPKAPGELVRCDREDYLEAYGLGVAAYEKELREDSR